MAERRPRGPSTFRQRDLAAALRATKQAGISNYRVEIEGQKIVVFVGDPAATVCPASAPMRQIG